MKKFTADQLEVDSLAWLARTNLPVGPLPVAPHRTISDPELWRQAVLRDLASLDVKGRWRADPAVVAARRRVLLAQIAEVRRYLEER